MLESFFNVFPSTLYHGLCFKMRRNFPLRYQLNAKTIEFISKIPERLYNERNKFLKKIMISAVITWKGISQPFFVGGNGIKVKGASYLKYLRYDLVPAVESILSRLEAIHGKEGGSTKTIFG